MESVHSRDSKASTAGNRIAFRWAAIVAIVSIVVSLVSNSFIRSNYAAFSSSVFFIGIVSIGCYFLAGMEHRKAMGGFISLKAVFRTIFLVILLSSVVIAAWDIAYFTLIDPEYADKITAGHIAYLKSRNVPQDQINQETERAQGGFTVGAALLVAARLIVIKSIFGMMCGFVIKRSPQVQML